MDSQARVLLNGYLAQLSINPLRTKMVTSGVLSFLQEVLASYLAGSSVQSLAYSSSESTHTRAVSSSKLDVKALKMAVYGCFISAPMSHILVGLLQKAFAGKNSKAARLGQVLASNLFIAPIQAFVYLVSVSFINGLREPSDIMKTVKVKFSSVLRLSWVTSPLALIIAQNFIPPELWVPWFNLVTFSVGTYVNTRLKKLAAKKL